MTTILQVNREDLKAIIQEEIAENATERVYSRFENSFVSPKEVAMIHNVSYSTVLRYIDDGLLVPEDRKTKEGIRFRLDYILKIDFRQLKQQLKTVRK